MANFTLIGTLDGSQPIEREFAVVAGTTSSCLVGDLVVCTNGYAAKVADDGIQTDGIYALVTELSTETATADGVVKAVFSPVGLVLRGKPTTASNLATAIVYDRVTIDVSGTTQTVDENDAAGGVVTILDYNATAGTIDVVVRAVL